MNIPVSGNAVAGRRLFLQNRHTLLDFFRPRNRRAGGNCRRAGRPVRL